MTAGAIGMGIRPAVGGRHAPRRVLFLAQRYFPYMGGLETHVYEVARRMVEAGVEVTVLTTDTGGTLPATDEVNGVRIERVRAWPAERDYYFAPGLYRAVQRGDWDVIHCQGCHTFFAPLAMLAAWRSGRPYVVSFHSGGPPNGLRRAFRRAQWAALRPLLARARRLVAVSKSEVISFGHDLGLSQERFTIIRNGAELPPVPAVAPRRESGTLIISPGRLQEYKGHHRLIAALPYILAERPDARLLILGAGPYEAGLRRLARETGVGERVDIRSIPPERREEMAATLAGAAIVTLLSEYEAHPIAVLEALALRLSVLVADTSGFRELAEEGLVRAIPLESSATEIAGAVLRQLSDPLNPGELHLPTWDDCTQQLLDLYRDVLSRDVTRGVRCAY